MAEYTLIPQSSLTDVLALNQACKRCRNEIAMAAKEGDDFVQAIISAQAIAEMQKRLSDTMLRDLLKLVGSPLGMSAETNYTPPMPVFRDGLLAGMLQGALPINGEIHFTRQGKIYLTKVYWERRFKSLEGVTNVMPPSLGLPKYTVLGDKSYATVEARLSYKLEGKPQLLDYSGSAAITVIANQGMMLDAIYGKVKKRLYQAAYATVSNTEIVDDHDPDEVQGTVLGSVVTPIEPQPLENPGDDIAADAAEALRNHTPAPELRDQPVPAHDKEWALDQMRRKPRKAVAAWVEHCSRQGLDITNEADEYLRSA